MNNSPNQESDSKAPFARKSLEPITEESVASSADLPVQSKVTPIQKESSFSSKSVDVTRPSKPCPFTQGDCPTKLAMERLSTQTGDSAYSDWSSTYEGSRRSYSSLLEKPFLFRRVSSLNEAVTQQEEKLTELYLNNLAMEPQAEEASTGLLRHTSSTTVVEDGASYAVDTKSQTDFSESPPSSASTHKALKYLMGLPSEAEEEDREREVGEGSQRGLADIDKVYIDDREGLSGETEAMKQAQRYIRVHRIFEFYQFLVAHLLSASPDNPINFLLELLDRCLIYRAGLGSPPLLYDRKHLTALFNLMDRMRTGYIEKEQYVTGMKTLGICSFNPDPPTVEGMVHKDFFVEEAYENLVSMLNDILRRRWIYFSTQPPPMKTPPPTPQFSVRSGKTNASSKRFQSDRQMY